MSTRPVTPARRRRRILRDTLLLAVVLAVLVLRMDFPVFTEGCFLIPYYIPSGSFLSSDALQVKGYDAAGALRYESPVPERWAGYGISVSGEVG